MIGLDRYQDDAPKVYCGVEEFGRPRWSHKPEIVGSNPTPATYRFSVRPALPEQSGVSDLVAVALPKSCEVGKNRVIIR